MYILLVEDDPKVADFIKRGLSAQGDQVDIAYDGLSGKQMIAEGKYDVAILDVILPNINGFELCRQIRLDRADIPILMLSALTSTRDKVTGLESGADDYLAKPFHFTELLARLRVLHRRRMYPVSRFLYKVADLEVEMQRRTVQRGGKEILLTATEFSLLELLLTNKGKVLSKAFISEAIWGISFDRRSNVVNVYINYLRSKIDKGFAPPLIHTVINSGFVLREP
jgi:two-component system, OmpR family, copper resistance phosphate regulon response regulator CusR